MELGTPYSVEGMLVQRRSPNACRCMESLVVGDGEGGFLPATVEIASPSMIVLYTDNEEGWTHGGWENGIPGN